eukprot:1535688-Rhodomonas_salina.3
MRDFRRLNGTGNTRLGKVSLHSLPTAKLFPRSLLALCIAQTCLARNSALTLALAPHTEVAALDDSPRPPSPQ